MGEIFEKVNLPLVAGAALEARDKFGQTALFIACMDDCLDPLDGARVSEHLLNVADKQGRTPLHSLAMHGSFELMKVLLEAGADPNMAAKYDQTPLHVAATTTGRPSSQRGTGRPAGRRAV